MTKDDKRIAAEVDGVARERLNDARPDFSQPPPRKQLPQEIQTKLNDEELWDTLYDGKYVCHMSTCCRLRRLNIVGTRVNTTLQLSAKIAVQG
jgi:hypothetical protein